MIAKINEEVIIKTCSLFRTMFRCEVEPGTPFTVVPEHDAGWDFSGIVSITGSLSGLLAMRYTKKLALFMFESAKLNNVDGSQPMLDDMVCEVANTLAGNVLSTAGLDELYMSVPVSVRGEGHTISWPKNTPVNSIPFRLGSENFAVQIGLS